MKIQSRITLICSVALALLLSLISFISYRVLYDNADREVQEREALMLDTAMAMRHYRVSEVRPELQYLMDEHFKPQTVPSYAAMTLFTRLRKEHSEYTYRETALNPTNPRDRPADWERDIIMGFRNQGEELQEISGIRSTPTDDLRYTARPITITQESYLTCHSTPEAAPASLIKTYGDQNGFGWKMNETVGAQIVSVPTTVTYARANNTFTILMLSLAGSAALLIIGIQLVIGRLVTRPIKQLADLCDSVSQGDFSQADPKTTSNDEISSLGRSFTRMKISLKKAMDMLDEDS